MNGVSPATLDTHTPEFLMNTTLKILVIDDSPVHQEAARKQLDEKYDLTVVGSYDEGRILLGYTDRWSRTDKHDFDVVLADLLMPASYAEGNGGKGGGEEMPVGIFLALLAAKNGARYVAMLTDSDHHSHPASACLDAFNKSESSPDRFVVAGAQMLLCNNRSWIQDDKSVLLKEETAPYKDGYGRACTIKTYQRIKRWDLLLEELLNPRPRRSKEEASL